MKCGAARPEPLPRHQRYAILINPDTKMSEDQEQALHELERSILATALAHRCKESLAWVRQHRATRARLGA